VYLRMGGTHDRQANTIITTDYKNLKYKSCNYCIRKGKRVKKGATIGRVDNELTFEVTQDSYHIDPMTLIK